MYSIFMNSCIMLGFHIFRERETKVGENKIRWREEWDHSDKDF